LHALRERGVEYIEVRCLDLDPFVPVGIEAETLRFLDVFLLHCLLADSPPDSPRENAALARNQERVASRGREPGLMVETLDGDARLVDWASAFLDACVPIAEALDALPQKAGEPGAPPSGAAALESARRALRDLSATPSARVLQSMTRQHGGEHNRFVAAQSDAARRQLRALPWQPEEEAKYRRMAEFSMAQQRDIEASDAMPFEAFRQAYVSADSLMVKG
jgi:glutamate--cysteine ligase